MQWSGCDVMNCRRAPKRARDNPPDVVMVTRSRTVNLMGPGLFAVKGEIIGVGFSRTRARWIGDDFVRDTAFLTIGNRRFDARER